MAPSRQAEPLARRHVRTQHKQNPAQRIAEGLLREPVGDVAKTVADDIVREYPELEKEDVYQAAKYGAWLASEKTIVIG